MPYRRALHRHFAAWLILTLLFSQIATAAYVCPMTQPSTPGTTDSMAGMPCADAVGNDIGIQLDPEQTGLCLQHCQFGKTQHPTDGGQVQTLALEPVLWIVLAPTDPQAIDGQGFIRHARTRDRAPPLAHSVAHCCYRI